MRLTGDVDALREQLEAASSDILFAAQEKARLTAELGAAKQAAEAEIALLKEMRGDLTRQFQSLSAEALKSQGEEITRRNKETLTATLAPLKEHVGQFQQDLKQMHEGGVRDRAALAAELKSLTERSQRLSEDAVALTRALKSDQQKQGAWGEMVLESLLERSGLRKGEEFETQVSRQGDEGRRLKPDVVVYLPGGKSIVVDSKVSLVAYTELVNAEDDALAEAAGKRHLESLRRHIADLGSKDYHAAEDLSVDYVILFVPIEGALSEALRLDGALTEYAVKNNVMIATPTTLMMALKTVANVWGVERRNKNAEKIAERAGRLYDKVQGFVSNMETLGGRLEQANVSYQDAFRQLSRGPGNVLGQVDALKKLGAKTTKTISSDFDGEDPDAPVERIAGE
ncbi:MAG: DNA recombination protein RmuC [Rhodobacteraceae bacterium]|nr:DNA recombination protein RmuC [Paracoccaceae bacterium]